MRTSDVVTLFVVIAVLFWLAWPRESKSIVIPKELPGVYKSSTSSHRLQCWVDSGDNRLVWVGVTQRCPSTYISYTMNAQHQLIPNNANASKLQFNKDKLTLSVAGVLYSYDAYSSLPLCTLREGIYSAKGRPKVMVSRWPKDFQRYVLIPVNSAEGMHKGIVSLPLNSDQVHFQIANKSTHTVTTFSSLPSTNRALHYSIEDTAGNVLSADLLLLQK